jgi:ATP-binding cassette subfamily F protein uup
LDEPTNDLDIETLEVLEDKLLEYQGTLIIVTHDREFLDNVVSSILVFEDSGIIQNYAGGFGDWHRRGIQLAEMDNPDTKKPVAGKTENKKNTNKKLTYKLKFELDSLPEKIAVFEEGIKKLHEEVNADNFYSKHYTEQQPILDELSYNQSELDKAISRWNELENLEQDLNL